MDDLSRDSITREQAKLCVGKGWHALLDLLYDTIPPDCIVTQVKEKYGTLRFYYAGKSEIFSVNVRYAEQRSGYLCERCGAPATTRNVSGWYLTACLTCVPEPLNAA